MTGLSAYSSFLKTYKRSAAITKMPMKAPLSRQSDPAPAGQPLSQVSQSADDISQQEAVVAKLAGLLGKETKGGLDGDMNSAKHVKGFFSKDVVEQDVVLVLPSLDIQLSEKNGGAIPDVGESRNAVNDGLPQRPTMTASVLTSAAKDAANAELEVAKSLGENSSWTKSTVGFAPAALVNNLSQSFSRLLGSRMKAWTLLLLRHSLSTGDESSRKRLLGILAASLKVESVTTNFSTIPLPESAKGQEKQADVILPLLFGATVTVTGQDETKGEPVTMRAPGTISGTCVVDERQCVSLVALLTVSW